MKTVTDVNLSISDAARGFSKQSIAALIDKNANISNSELAYYFVNYNNSSAILDAINFGENVSCGYNSDFKEYGIIFYRCGSRKTHLFMQESGKTINVDAKIKQLNDINWIEIGYKEGNTFSVYGKEYAIDSSGHINVSAEDEFTSTGIKYPSRSI